MLFPLYILFICVILQLWFWKWLHSFKSCTVIPDFPLTLLPASPESMCNWTKPKPVSRVSQKWDSTCGSAVTRRRRCWGGAVLPIAWRTPEVPLSFWKTVRSPSTLKNRGARRTTGMSPSSSLSLSCCTSGQVGAICTEDSGWRLLPRASYTNPLWDGSKPVRYKTGTHILSPKANLHQGKQ